MPGRCSVRSDLERRPVRVPLPALGSRLCGNAGRVCPPSSRLRGTIRVRAVAASPSHVRRAWRDVVRLARFGWRSPQYPPHPSASATTVIVTGFLAAFRPSSQTSFTTCGETPPAGRVLAPPCYPARCRITLFGCVLAASKREVHALRLDAAILRFRGAVPMMVGSALVCCCNTCVVVLSSCFELGWA